MKKPMWLSEKEVAHMTGRAEQTLRNDRCNRRGIPYCKIGRSVRYRLEDVVYFMEASKITFN
ncbi:helix-turn-helix domain-containing protein [Desulforhopalus singaporensis]|uniref:Helix-turn-helix domain-containing protein n=1 Tax=Desulforhopalus singaporensis TaxID=91360 RepID=A0A1H0VCD9_9BACT|nr:helix-turn-helix domain-containing protein [Desulforhopalus singaporensis]SDP76011.1 Helix-turn-helix domain-containing protein [Desulforhopalus singaporensis]